MAGTGSEAKLRQITARHMTYNAQLSGETLSHLVALGVKDFVVCAGARNAPIVTSLLAVEAEKELQVFHHFDERSAAFFALGLAKSSGVPAAVLTTSGTAVAELHGAVIEAFYAGIPLIAVTADRPSSFRGSGAPQAIEQAGIFGPCAPIALDVQQLADLRGVVAWNQREPLHINVCFEEPTCQCWVDALPEINLPKRMLDQPEDDDLGIEAFVAPRSGLVVILGELPRSWHDGIEEFLHQLQVPIWAEVTSGLRWSKRLADYLLSTEKDLAKLSIHKVLRIGGVPSLRFWRDLENHLELEVMSVTTRPFSGLARASRNLVISEFPRFVEWAPVGEVTPIPSPTDLDSVLEKHPESEVSVVRELSKWIPTDACVFLGNSLPIREWNLAADCKTAHAHCHANRGANGIDGEIATFLGLSEGAEESWGLFGDLTALYDLNAPALLDQLSSGKRRIVILNNGGGKIFSRLPSMTGLSVKEKQVTENHHQTRFASWAEMWGMNYVQWKAGDDTPELGDSTTVIEVILNNEASEAFWNDWS